MGEAERGRAGGIVGLLSVLREHRGAIEYDLLTLGLDLDDLPGPELSWHRLLTVVNHCGPDTALWRSVNPHWVQTPDNDFMRAVEFGVRQLVWLNTEDGRKGRNQPKPFLWPWEAEAERAAHAIRGDAVTVEEANRRLGWTRQKIDAQRLPSTVPADRHRAFSDDEE